ncbi:transporter substrate-binding domain-containing protein [bacterium]|nr:transporter substrate-binding domain-containing protein [bacterium]
MKKLSYAALTSAIILFSTPTLAATKVDIYGDDGYPPYSYTQGGEIVGIDTRIIAEAGKRMPDYDITLKPVSWKKGLNLLENGKIGFLYPPYYRPELRPYMTYTDDLLTEELVLFCRTELVDKGLNTFPDDFKGLSVGKKLGYAPGDAFDKAAKDGIIKIVEMKETKAILNRLIKGGIDCYINDRLSVLFELKEMQQQGAYDGDSIKPSVTMSAEKVFIGVTKKTDKYPYTVDFVKQFNKALNEMKTDGTLDKIINE